MCVCTRAYEEQEGEEKGLEIEEGELEEWVSSCCGQGEMVLFERLGVRVLTILCIQ